MTEGTEQRLETATVARNSYRDQKQRPETATETRNQLLSNTADCTKVQTTTRNSKNSNRWCRYPQPQPRKREKKNFKPTENTESYCRAPKKFKTMNLALMPCQYSNKINDT
ncbi:hypothetical protein I3843_01G099300 [Carya illinoinensis]|nr:hypothetical protein I3760_01G102000 [Carya illinoinensis]KAG7995253.1 hypothetical protein I3843_01G099300 [Carya illinoinensis]